MLRRTFLGGALATAGAAAGGGCASPPGPDWRTPEGKAALIQRGEAFRAGLERYRTRHGRYPDRLVDAGVAPEPSDRAYGGWDYRPDASRRTLGLRTGGYARYGLVLYWQAQAGRWEWDT